MSLWAIYGIGAMCYAFLGLLIALSTDPFDYQVARFVLSIPIWPLVSVALVPYLLFIGIAALWRTAEFPMFKRKAKKSEGVDY